jgi:outer membrane protein insertion porin family
LAQTNKATSTSQPTAALGENEKTKTVAEIQATVAKIEIKYVGPALVPEEVVLTNRSVKLGDLFQPSAIDEDVRHLYATGLFRSIRVADQAQPEGRTLTYEVQCKPLLSDIKFTGSAKFNDAQLREQISAKIGEAVDERSLFKDSETIRTLYEQAGLSRPSVKYVLDMDEPAGRGGVTFQITESP